MATFTMELHKVMELTDDIGLNDYPVIDGFDREALNKKIIDHYVNREIGVETVSMFRLAVRRKMNEIMPYYNQLYKSAQMTFDPLQTVDIRNLSTTTGTAESTENSDTTSTSKSESAAVASDFPQVRLDRKTKDYATTGQENVSGTEATGTGHGTSTTAQDGTTDSTTTGFQGNRSALLMEYRETFINVDMMVIDELEECFMQLWSNGDSYSGGMTNGSYYGIGWGYFPL